MNFRYKIDPAYLNEAMEYEPLSGVLTWKIRPRSHFKTDSGWRQFNSDMAGKTVGCEIIKPSGRKASKVTVISMRGKQFRIQLQLAIFIMLQRPIPAGCVIDHKNRDPWDNRLENLRIATRQQNSQNQIPTRERALPRGVKRHKKKFQANICFNRKNYCLGCFETPEKAFAARLAKERELRGEFAPE